MHHPANSAFPPSLRAPPPQVSSDHSPAPPSLKETQSGNFLKAWGGISGAQYLLPATWTALRNQVRPCPERNTARLHACKRSHRASSVCHADWYAVFGRDTAWFGRTQYCDECPSAQARMRFGAWQHPCSQGSHLPALHARAPSTMTCTAGQPLPAVEPFNSLTD